MKKMGEEEGRRGEGERERERELLGWRSVAHWVEP